MPASLQLPALARPAGLRQRCTRAARRPAVTNRGSAVVVRADIKAKYQEISDNVPPIVTAATLPVIGLSLLCKAATGHGLPGDLLGAIEGVSFLILPLGLGSFLPRAGEILSGGDFSQAKVQEILLRDTRGESASARVSRISSTVDPNSALGMQLADLERRKKELAAETPEQRAERERKKAELAAMALKIGKKISSDDVAKAEGAGSANMVAQPVTQTLAQGMTVENFDQDVTKMSDDSLAKVNLSTPKLEESK